MELTDPHGLLGKINLDRWNSLRQAHVTTEETKSDHGVTYVEPYSRPQSAANDEQETPSPQANQPEAPQSSGSSGTAEILQGKVQQLGDFVDTDAVRPPSPLLWKKNQEANYRTIKLAPAEFLIGMSSNEVAGMHCLQHTNPDFRDRVKQGFNIVVAGKGFGCGSSREQAVMALLGMWIDPHLQRWPI